MTSTRRFIICQCGCKARGRIQGHNWIAACYSRWLRAGKPAGGPPPRVGSARLQSQRKAGRVEDYAWLRADLRLSIEDAAARLGVCKRTAERYEADLRARAA